jgi:ActR/RegA family two-component response regulator
VSDIEKMGHREAIQKAINDLNVNPDYVMQRYLQAVFEEEDFNVSRTARRLNMYRRTVQRMLAAKQPVHIPPRANLW